MNRVIKAATLIAVLAAPALFHVALFHTTSRVLPVAFLILQLGSLGLFLSAQLKGRTKALAVALIGAGILLLAPRLGNLGSLLSSGLSHTLINGLLVAVFGASLKAGREPLITGIMRRIRGTLPPELLRYGRQLTIFWCGVAVGQLLTSFVLATTAPIVTWSLFVNVLSAPLVLLIFAMEILYHTIRFRHLPRSRVTDLIKTLANWRLPSTPTIATN